ncbi:MAG: hypothetical protein K2Q26_12180 [Bdellovibrionales bacterium]|nr:hypothetical protein [Bdellovibrionales bacterium]
MILPTKAKRLHWPIIDPANAEEEKKPEQFRTAKKIIREKLLEFGDKAGLDE